MVGSLVTSLAAGDTPEREICASGSGRVADQARLPVSARRPFDQPGLITGCSACWPPVTCWRNRWHQLARPELSEL